MTDLIKQVGDKINISNLYNNPIVFAVLSIFLTMYGPRLQPGLPKPIMEIFNNNYFRFTVMLLIAYLSSRNLQLAIILSMTLCLLTSLSSTQEMYMNFGDLLKKALDKNKKSSKLGDLLKKALDKKKNHLNLL